MTTPLDLENGATIQTFTPGSQIFGRYTLQRFLGAGKKGDVWLAKDEKLGMEVAIKLLRNYPHFRALESQSGRLLDLAHHGIVRLYDTAGDEQLAGFVMEYFESRPLATILAEREARPFETTEIQRWVKDLFSSLAYAHSRFGIVHQDIRLANMLVSPQGVMKVSEFGLAPELTFGSTSPTDTDFKHLPAVSPQVLAGEAPTHQDDLYAAASAVYELLTGKPVFPGGNLVLQIQKKVPPSIAERRAELQIKGDAVPKAWEQWIAQCLEKDREKRPASAQEILSLIESGITTRGGGTRAAVAMATVGDAMGSLREKDLSWLGSLMKSAAALAVVGAAVWFFWVKPAQEQIAERQEAISEIEKEDEVAETKYSEARAGAPSVSRLQAAQEILTLAAARWDGFISEYQDSPIAFTDEDQDMLKKARKQQSQWVKESAVLEVKINNLRLNEQEQVNSLRDECDELNDEDAKFEVLDLATRTAKASERLAKWDKLIQSFDTKDAPQTADYKRLIEGMHKAKAGWEVLVEQEKTAAQQWVTLQETSLEGLQAFLAIPEKTKPERLKRITEERDKLTKSPAPRLVVAKSGELLSKLQKLQEETLKIPDPVPPEPFPTKLGDFFKDTTLAGKSDALHKQALINLQQQLTSEGFYKGEAKGALEPALEQSLKDWQTSKAMVSTGRLDTSSWSATTLGKMQPADLDKMLTEQVKAVAPTVKKKYVPKKKVPEEEPGFWRKFGNKVAEPFKKDDGKSKK